MGRTFVVRPFLWADEMSRSLGVLTLDLIAKTSNFEQGMDRAGRRVRSTADEMEAARRTADRYVMAIGAAGVAFASAAAAMAVSAAKSMDATAKMAQQVGTTTEALTGMRFAAQQFANISDQQFDMSMRRMTRRIAEAAEGSGAAKGALDAMGLSARQLAQLAPEKQMLAIAEAMHRTERQADRLRYTMAIFDTEGMALVPALQQGAAAFEQNIEVARRFGVVLSTEAAQAAEQFTSNMSLLNSAQQGFKQQIAESLLPTLADLSDRLVELSERVGPMGEVISTALKAAGVAALATATIFTSRLIASIAKTGAAWLAATASAARYQMQMSTLASAIAGTNRALTASTATLAGGMAVISRAGQLALSVLGGPVGLLVTTGLTAAALLSMGRDAKTASVDIDDLSESFKTLSAQKLELRLFDLEDEVQRLEDQARQSGEILRTMESDALALADAQGVTAEELENVRRSLLEQRDAHDTNNAELDRARTLLNQVIDHLERMQSAARGAAGGVDALNQAMHSEAGEKYLVQLQGQIKALQDGGDPIKIATRWISEHADATDADKAAIMSAAHALKALQEARNQASRTTSTATKTLTEAQRAAQNFRREQDQSLRSQLQSVSAIHSQAQALEDQIAVYGLGRTALEDLTIARLEEQAAMLRSFDGSQEAVEAIEREIEARQRLRTAIGSMEQKEAEKANWEAWARDVEQIFDRVGQSLTDAIFDGGRSAKDLLRDLFKGLTFNILINPVMGAMQGWVTNQLGGLFGMQQPGGGAGGVLSAVNTARNLNTLGGAVNQMFTGSSVGASNLSLGYANTVGAFGGDSIGALIQANGGWESALSGLSTAASSAFTLGAVTAAPTVAATLSAPLATSMATTSFSASLAGGAASGGAAAGGLMSGLSTAMPWIGGGLALASAFGLFGDRIPTTRRSKQGASHMLPDGTFEVAQYDSRQDSASQEAARDFAQEAVKHANDLFQRIGVDAGIQSFQTLMESSILGDKQGVGSSGQVRIGDVLREIGLTVEPSWSQHGVGGWSDAEMLPRLQQDIQLTLLEAFQAAGDELPDLLSSILEGADIRGMAVEQALELSAAFNQMVEAISGLRESLENLPFTQLRDLSFDAAANLIQFAGGLEQLDAGLTSYFQNFYSQEEQLAHQTEQLSRAFGELGLTLPDVASGADEAKSAYRSIVESLDLTTEEGQRAYATLMTLSGGFHELVTGMDQLAQSTGNAATRFDSLINSLMGMASDALSAVQQRGQEQIERLSESFARTDAVFNAYRSQVQQLESQWGSLISTMDRSMRDLRGQVEASSRLQYNQARSVISTALLTGQMPQTADLGEAIRTAQQGVTGGRYASAFEQREAYLKLANELEALQGIAKPELDAAQASLEQLEKQYNRLRGIEDYSGKSLSQLEKQLGVALSAEAAARTQIEQIERQITMAQLQYQQLVGINDELSTLPGALNALANAVNAANAAREAAGKAESGVSRETRYLANNPDVLDQYLKGYGGNMSAEELARYHYDKYGRNEGRSFDVGTPYVPYDMSANIHRGEIIIDPRSSDILRRYGIGVQGTGDKALERRMERVEGELVKTNQYLYQITKETKRTALNTEDTATAVGAHSESEGLVVVY